MLNFKTFFLLEGGAGGSIEHPYALTAITNGDDLINFFKRAFSLIKRGKGSLKLDGINVSSRLINVDTKHPKFVLDRGSKKDRDINGVSIEKLKTDFSDNPGLVAAAEKTLTVLNDSIEDILPELDKLGFFHDPTLYLNIEFVEGQTNVLNYDHNFLAIHGIKKFTQDDTMRKGMEVPYDKNAMDSLIKKINKVAHEHNFKVYGDIPVKVKGTPNFDKVLSQTFTIVKNGKKYKESLIESLKKAQNPFGKKVTLLDGKRVGALSKLVYVNILNGMPVEDFIKDKKDFTTAVDGAVINHGARALGAEILKHCTSEMGDTDAHEGIIIRDKSVSPTPIKITGNFIVKGLKSKFNKNNIKVVDQDEEGQINSIEDREKMVYFDPGFGDEGRTLSPKISTFGEMMSMTIGHVGTVVEKVVVIYPGRFQPFHLGHASVYNKIKKEFPTADVYIATSNKEKLPKNPFNFEEKMQMIVSSGIDPALVMKTKNPWAAKEISGRYNKEHTKLIFAIGEKDAENYTYKRQYDGKPSYMQKYKSVDDCKPMGEHAYVMIAPHMEFTINGNPVSNASQIREKYRNADDTERKRIITDLYGKFRPEIYNLFNKKLY